MAGDGRGDSEPLAITIFETVEDLHAGDQVLNSMNPPGEGPSRRTFVKTYEVGVT